MSETDAGPYGPTWYAATMVAAPERPALSLDLDVDACVIGAGLAGLTVARELARRGWSVAVLDAGRVAGSASGRNAGFVSPGFSERIDAIVDRVGLPRAKELWALSDAGAEYIRREIVANEMPGVDARDGRLSVRRIDDEQSVIDQAAMLKVDFGAEVEAWPTGQVREVLRSRHYFQAVHFPKAFHIHPLNYALGLAAAAEKDGARIFQDTPALSLDAAGIRKRIQTPKAAVRARHVVLAGSIGTGEVDGSIAETVLPVSTYVAVTAPLGEKLFEAVRYSGAVADTRRAGDYYRIVADDRLLWGGRISARASRPWRLKAMLRKDLLKVYPQLSDVEIDYAWAGTMAYAVHKMPQIGELGQGYWLASAFGGHGLNTTAMAGEMIARAIMDGDDRWRLFSPYELVWAGGRTGRIGAQAMFWSMRARDALQEKIARYRDRARHEAEERQRRFAEERDKRVAEREQQRREEEAQRKADAEAKRVAAEAAARAAVERDRAEAERARAEAEAARRAAEDARKTREEDEGLAAEKAMRDAASAAEQLGREIEQYKVQAAAAVETKQAETADPTPSTTIEPAPDIAAVGAVADQPPEPEQKKPKRKRTRKKKETATVSAEGAPPDSGG